MKWKTKLKIMVAAVLTILIILFVTICVNFEKASDMYAGFEVKNFLISGINEIVKAQTENSFFELPNAINISYKDGEISSISVNSAFLNIFCAEITSKSNLFINENKKSLAIPIGNTLPFKLFSGRGFGIYTEIVPLGSVCVSTESNFYSAGINQTVHRIVLRINAVCDVLFPFKSNCVEINIEYVISETVIIGKVPEIYLSREATP